MFIMDSELQAIREARLAALKGGNDNGNSTGAPQGGGNGSGSNSGSTLNAQTSHFLEAAALERLSRVAMVRPERARAVEAYLVKLATSGALTHKLSETELVRVLDGIAKNSETKIVFNRRDEDVEELEAVNNCVSDDEDDFFD